MSAGAASTAETRQPCTVRFCELAAGANDPAGGVASNGASATVCTNNSCILCGRAST
jgi:hypothetical protein